MIINTEPKEIAKQTEPKTGQLSSAQSSLLHPPAEPSQRKAERKALTAKPTTKRQSSPPKCRTIVQAQIDVGFGNSLFIRGEGAGLSWDKGQPLTCVDGNRWDWSSEQAKDKVVFKLLLNDTTWTKGENVEVQAGKTVKIVPQF